MADGVRWVVTRACVAVSMLMIGMGVGWASADGNGVRRPAVVTIARQRPMDGWYAYDYQRGLSTDPPENVFFRATPGPYGGVWVDDTRWSIDTPETPDSVLALIRYEHWAFQRGRVVTDSVGGRDLRHRCATFELRGNNLDLRGGHATFWVMASAARGRWHTTAPLVIGPAWTRNTVRFADAAWHQSWDWGDGTIQQALADANSYGIGFVGFDGEPTGALGLRDFRFAECP